MRTISENGRGIKTRHVRGFTLIEMLVVLIVLSISASLVVVNLSRNESTALEDEGRRLALLLEFARNEAIVSGQPLAWAVNDDGYTFTRKPQGSGWIQLDTDGMLASRKWSQRSKMAGLLVAGLPSAAGDPIIFTTSGINLPFEMVLAAGAWRVTLSGDHAGKVRVMRPVRITMAAP